MKKKIFVAGNWKSNKTITDSSDWLHQFRIECTSSSEAIDGATVVVCAPYLALPSLSAELKSNPLGIELAAQDSSAFDAGAFTGEVTAIMIKEVASWVLIGHSERRTLFSETDEMLAKKVEKAKAAGLKIIFCVQDESTAIPAGVDVVAYEPVWAIGTGKTDTPENANAVITSIKAKSGVSVVIYGGSITADNVAVFTAQPAIDGVLPGGASLDPSKFVRLVVQANSTV